MAVPGEYQATFAITESGKSGSEDSTGGADENNLESIASTTTTFSILKDPRSSATQEDLKAQFEFLMSVREKLSETHKSIGRLRDVRQQIQALSNRIGKNDDYIDVVTTGKEIVNRLTAVEKVLYQTQNQAPQDPLNFF